MGKNKSKKTKKSNIKNIEKKVEEVKEVIEEKKEIREVPNTKVSEKTKMSYLNVKNAEDSLEIKKFLTILSVTVLSLIGIYLLFSFLQGDYRVNLPTGEKESKFNPEIIVTGQIESLSDKEYLVFAYEFNDIDTEVYKSKLELFNYLSKDIKLFQLNLEDGFNKRIRAEMKKDENITKDLKKLKIYKRALIRVKNKKIEEVIVGENIIKKMNFYSNMSKKSGILK